MSLELHIDPLSSSMGDVGVTAPEFQPDVSSANLLTRIWVWLSQLWGRETFCAEAESVFCLQVGENLVGHRFQNVPLYEHLNRHERRAIARQTLSFGLAAYQARQAFFRHEPQPRMPLPAGSSPSQMRDWVEQQPEYGRFQSRHSHFYALAFFRHAAMRLRFAGVLKIAPLVSLCHAPLTLE